MLKIHLARLACLLVASLPAVSATSAQFVAKPIGENSAKLPLLSGFSPACEENSQLAQRAQLMAPKAAIFLTCFVDSAKWRNFAAGRSADLYPYIAVSIQAPLPGGGYSKEEFEKLRTAAYKQLGGMLEDAKVMQQQLSEQDRKLAASGVAISRGNYQQSMQGFFEPPGATESFSYIAIRSSTVSEAGVMKALNEVNAVSTVLYSGRLLMLNVIDQTADKNQGLRAQHITAEWLRSFRELNEKAAR